MVNKKANMLTKVVLIGLLVILFLWVLYERKKARTQAKREGYQVFTFNYTDEAPTKDFSGVHPAYEFREFYREHFTEFGRRFSDSDAACPSAVCSNVQANSLYNINPIDVGDQGFVMTLDMGQLPRQYHYRTTNKGTDNYTGLDEAMVFNGFDINHERSSMSGHNPYVRGFAAQCQKTTANCTTDSTTGKRTCAKETVSTTGATDLTTLDHFMFKSTDINDKKQGLGRFMDMQDRVVFIRIARESRRGYIITDTPNRNLLYAWGKSGSYTYKLVNTNNSSSNGLTTTFFDGYVQNNIFGMPGVQDEKFIFVAVQLDNQSDYDTLYSWAVTESSKSIQDRLVDIADGYVFVGSVANADTWEIGNNIWREVARDGGWYDATQQDNVLMQYEIEHHKAYRIFSRQRVQAWPSYFNGIDPLNGQMKYLRTFPYPVRFLLIDNDIIPPLMNQPPINAPNLGNLKAIKELNDRGQDGYVYTSADGLNARATSIFDGTPVLLDEPIAGVCSMVNVSHDNTAIPDYSDPNTSTYFTLEAPQTLFPTGPSKLTSLYASELLTLEKHRNSIAYGGFVMNTISTSSLYENSPSSVGVFLNTMASKCTIKGDTDKLILDLRKSLLSAGIAGNPDCSTVNSAYGGCVPSPVVRLYNAVQVLSDRWDPNDPSLDPLPRERNALVVLTKLVEWNMIRWFAMYTGKPSLTEWQTKFELLFEDYYNQVRAGVGFGFSTAAYSRNALLSLYAGVYNNYIAPTSIKNANLYQTLSKQIGNLQFYPSSKSYEKLFSNSSINPTLNQFLFDLFYSNGDTVRLRALINSYDPWEAKRTWIYALYPEDRKRSRIYFDGYGADVNNRWASGAFKVNDPRGGFFSQLGSEIVPSAIENFLNGTGSYMWNGKNINDYFPLRSIVVPHKFKRGSDEQMTMVNSFPRVYAVLKFYSASNDVMFTLFWAHIPLYPGCGYPTMNYEVTDKYGKPDFMNNNYSDNIFIFYLVGSESKWKEEIINNGISPICEEDFYIESVYHGSAQCLRAIDNASKRLNCGNYVLFGEDGLVATVAPKDSASADVLGGEMGSFRIYCDDKGLFVYKRKISTNSQALSDYTVYSDYIALPGMKSCKGFSCWTPFREKNGAQTVLKSIKIEPPLDSDSLDASKPPTAATPIQITATDNYRNIAQKREMIQTYAAFKHPCHPARVNTPVIKNINVLKAEGWRIVNVGGSGWIDPKTTYLNTYKVQQKDDYTVAPYNMNYKTEEQVDKYGGVVGTMVSKWGLPTQEKFISRGEWIQLEFPSALSIEEYRLRIPSRYVSSITQTVSSDSANSRNTLPNNRSISDWTVLGSNDDGVNKKWVLIDIQKNVEFVVNTDPTTTESGNQGYVLDCTFICNLKTAMSFRFVRLVVNGLHPNNFENIFALDWFAVRQGSSYYPEKGASNNGVNVSTSIAPYGFDNNYNYTDSLNRPLVPIITSEAPEFWEPPYNNATLDRNGSKYYKTIQQTSLFGDGYYGDNPNFMVHNMDNKWSYNKPLGKGVTTNENWKANFATKAIGNPRPDFNSVLRDSSSTLRTFFTSATNNINISLGSYLFTWPELHLYMDTVKYAQIKQNNATQNYNFFLRFGLFHYNKIVKDGAWRRNYSLSLDGLERYYEGSTITTYVYPCSVGDAGSNCSVYNNRAPVSSINILRPDQEIADPRFSWPQPYQGGSYLVSSSVKCVAGQTCNSVGGNTTNVTPKYCFWIGDSATYTALENAGFSVQQEFNMNIMFDGDSNVYNDVPSQCLGKLTLSNLDFSPLSQFYPPPALYRQKGWKLIDYPDGLNLVSGGVRQKNAIISENNQVIFSFPDVETALAYKEFDANTPEETKVYNGCQGPALIGTSVTISCPVGKLKATSGAANESTSHIRWGKWNASVCRDSFGDTLIEAPFQPLPARCVGKSTCAITEADFGWGPPYPRDTTYDACTGVTLLDVRGFDGQHQFSSINEIQVYTAPNQLVKPNRMAVSRGNPAFLIDGDPNTMWDPDHMGGDHWVQFYFDSPINVYKIDFVAAHIPVRCAGMVVRLFGPAGDRWIGNPIVRPDGGGNYGYVSDNGPSYKYISMWPGMSRSLFLSNTRLAYWWEYPQITYDYNIPEGSTISGAKTICINYADVSGGIRNLQISDLKIYSSPKTLVSLSESAIAVASTLSSTYGKANMIDDTPTFWHSSNEFNPGTMITLPDNTPIYKIVVGNRRDCCSSRMTGVVITIRNSIGKVLFQSDKFKDKNTAVTGYSDGHTGYNYYAVFPAYSSTVIASDSDSSISPPSGALMYQKRQWQVGFQCDYSDTQRAQRFQIPVGVTSRQLHENYYNLMKQVNRQTSGVFDIKDYPETLKLYGEEMKKEVLNNPKLKAEIRKSDREYYKSLRDPSREHYWDGDICKPIGEVFELVANGVLEGIYNPIVSGINKIGLLERGLGLTTQTVSIDWSCPIPGLGEAIAAIVNAALAVGRAFVAAYDFVCQLGEALVGAIINAGKYLFNRLQSVFTAERFSRFLRGFSNGLSGGFSLIGSLSNNFSWIGDALSNLGNLVVNLGNSVAKFFMEPSIDNFVDIVSNLLTLGIEAFIFVLEIGLSILGVLADIVGAFIGFLADIGSWVVNSVIGPIAAALSTAYDSFISFISSWF